MKKNLTHIIMTACFCVFFALALLMIGTFVPFGGYDMRVVLTGSMSPTIPVGSAILIRPADAYAVGDIVTYQRIGDEAVTTHRIVQEESIDGETLYRVQGDANDTADQRPVRQNEISGKVSVHVPYLGYVIDFIRQPLGFVIVIGIPAALIVYEQVVHIIGEAKKQNALASEETAP